MKKLSRKTPFLMMLVLSLIASQLFLKAFGINLTPSFGTLAHSWSRVASAVGVVYQPGFVAELNALGSHLFCDEKGQPINQENPCGVLACNQSNDFDFEMPPAIELNEPDYGVEPQKAVCWKSADKPMFLKDKKLATEVVEIAADADDDAEAGDSRGESTWVSIPAPLPGEAAADSAEAEGKATFTSFESKVFMTSDEGRVAPKAEKLRKPCPEQEQLKREEMKRLEENLRNFEELKMNCDIPLMQAMASLKSLEKARRYRVMVRVNPSALPRTFEPTPNPVVGPEESEL